MPVNVNLQEAVIKIIQKVTLTEFNLINNKEIKTKLKLNKTNEN